MHDDVEHIHLVRHELFHMERVTARVSSRGSCALTISLGNHLAFVSFISFVFSLLMFLISEKRNPKAPCLFFQFPTNKARHVTVARVQVARHYHQISTARVVQQT